MDRPSTVPQEVRLARAIRGLRDTLIACGAACLGLAVVASAILLLSGSDPAITGPVLMILGGGQLLALVGAVIGGLGLRAVLAGRPVEESVVTVRRRLRLLVRAVLVWSVGTAAGWTVADPSAVVLVLALAAVTAQLGAVLLVLRRRLPRGAA